MEVRLLVRLCIILLTYRKIIKRTKVKESWVSSRKTQDIQTKDI